MLGEEDIFSMRIQFSTPLTLERGEYRGLVKNLYFGTIQPFAAYQDWFYSLTDAFPDYVGKSFKITSDGIPVLIKDDAPALALYEERRREWLKMANSKAWIEGMTVGFEDARQHKAPGSHQCPYKNGEDMRSWTMGYKNGFNNKAWEEGAILGFNDARRYGPEDKVKASGRRQCPYKNDDYNNIFWLMGYEYGFDNELWDDGVQFKCEQYGEPPAML